MKIYQCVKWLNKYVYADKPIKQSHIFFDFIEISEHFKGFQDGGFRIEIFNKKGEYFSFNFKTGFKKHDILFNGLNPHIVIRFNKPIISLGHISNIKEHFRNVEVTL